jgi:hypothetical protein
MFPSEIHWSMKQQMGHSPVYGVGICFHFRHLNHPVVDHKIEEENHRKFEFVDEDLNNNFVQTN